MKKRQGRNVSQEEMLLDYVRQSSAYRKGRHAVHVKMSALQRHYQQQSWLIEAARSWLPFNQQAMGELYKLANHDYWAVYPDESGAEVERAVMGLMRVFRDDPAILRAEGGDSTAFVERFDLATEYERLLTLVEAAVAGAPAPAPEPAAVARPVPAGASAHVVVAPSAMPAASQAAAAPVRATLPPATIEDLPSLLRAIGREDPPAILTRRLVHAVQSDAPPRHVMTELRPDMLRILTQLRATGLAGSNPWVEHLLRDKCLELGLKGAAASWTDGKEAIVIPTSMAATRSAGFDALSRRIVGQEQRVLFKFAYEECLLDLPAFANLTDGLKARGFGIMVGGLTPAVFAMLNPAPLNAKFLRMEWPAGDHHGLSPAMAAALAARLQTMDRVRVMLGNCESKVAIEFGKALGIALFEGSAVTG